jgi:N-acetylmuramic acid 6-phosphate etherase
VAELVRLLHEEDRAAVEAVRRALPGVSLLAQTARDALVGGGRLVYVGAGTSGRLGALDAAECPPTFGARPSQVVALVAGGHRALRTAVEGAEDDAAAGGRDVRRLRVGERDLVLGISASATTPYVLGALRAARRARARTALLCCNPAAADPRAAEQLLVLETGPELVAGSTRLKAGTATKLVLNAISTAAFVGLGRVYRGHMVALRPTNRKLRARAELMAAELTQLPLPRARALLRRAGGEVRVAVAMHLTGLPAARARAAVNRHGLRALGAAGSAR